MRIAAGLTLGALLGLSALAAGQSSPATSEPSGRFVAIGCLTRQGAASQPRYIVSDTRSPHTVYRLTGDSAQLALHVGHTVEVAGPITSVGAAQPTLKVTSLVWIASSCKK